MIEENFNLKAYNSFGINVEATYFARFTNVETLQQILQNETIKKETILILGGGSNILFTKNFEGLILKNEIEGIIVLKEDEQHIWVKVGAGVGWHNFVLHCIANNWSGVENLSLIPGCVGAAPMQNIGAYGVEVKDVIETVTAIQINTLEEKIFTNAACNFGYRESIFKKEAKGEYIITNVCFKLNKQPTFHTSYGAINTELEKMQVKKFTIKAISDAVINIRNSKLPNPKEIGNAGSFFKNPSIPKEQFNALQKFNPTIVGYANADGSMKLAAGWLIEQCGYKGVQVGNTGCHQKQALVLVNYGNATGSEIYSYSEVIINGVASKFGVTLEREVNIV